MIDLEDDHESQPISQYEYVDMHDELTPGIDIPLDQEDPPPDDVQEGADPPPESAPPDDE